MTKLQPKFSQPILLYQKEPTLRAEHISRGEILSGDLAKKIHVPEYYEYKDKFCILISVLLFPFELIVNRHTLDKNIKPFLKSKSIKNNSSRNLYTDWFAD